MNPLVSIIMPTYNGASRIARAIESVRSQTYPQWELIVVSDGSTDDTGAVVGDFSKKDPRIVLVGGGRNEGVQRRLNQGLGIAKGTYVARIDDDDQWMDPEKLSSQVAFLQEHPGHVLVGTDAVVTDAHGRAMSVNVMPKTDEVIRSRMLSKNCFLHSTVLADATALKRVGGYSEKKGTLHVEDYDLWLKIGGEGKMANLEMRSTALVAHASSLTFRNRVSQARNALRTMLRYRNRYPRFLLGYAVALARLFFFSIVAVIPFPRSAWYAVQRVYKRV